MLLPLAFLLQLSAALPQEAPAVHHGRQSQLDVRVPRIESPSAILIDGVLDEAEWTRAAVLTGFSSYRPVDGREAPDSTDVLLWYSPTAMHVGVRAHEPHGAGAVRATLAERDRIGGDDNVELHFDTFHELKRAFVFVVNPLGVQADGTKSEGGAFLPGGAFPGETDYSPDFQWESKGRLTEGGFEVEIRIPFTSLRYPGRGPDTWGFNVVRVVRHSGWEETWTPARKGAASFIAQGGRLVGMEGMRRGGRVVEVIPEVRARLAGADTPAGDWRYERHQDVGGNVRWAVTSNYTLNAAVKPDFSQVEADATQIASDPRFAPFYPERRPFFVDAIEQFGVPNSLVYTRRIVEPVAAGKLTGKLGRTDVAVLAALDEDGPLDGVTGRPQVGVLRLSHAIGLQSTAGAIYTERSVGDDYNRLGGLDAKLVFGGMYFAQLQAVASATRDVGGARGGPLWMAVLDRTGRSWGFNYSLIGVDPDFRAQLGFVTRTGYVKPSIMNRFTFYGRRGALLESWTSFVRMEGVWTYDDFVRGRSVLEDLVSVSSNLALRGGWSASFTPRVARFAFDPAPYARLAVVHDGAWLPFTVAPRRTVGGVSASVGTPRWQRFAASASTSVGNDIDFAETSVARRTDASVSLTWRPTSRARIDGSYQSSRLARTSDGSTTTQLRIPRLKTEYQLARPLLVRVVAQYEARRREAPRDWRTGQPLGLPIDGAVRPIAAVRTNDLRADALLSYRPTPGTVFFVGYGSSMTEADPLALDGLRRTADGVFVKGSYLLR
ncbi:MAG TPA: DUF5916 domain-containing protein [Gemmatimonadaceae bacterium]|nr:DUF5916 domain-containing protein [Gemmatimonadaceae bacterium]